MQGQDTRAGYKGGMRGEMRGRMRGCEFSGLEREASAGEGEV